MSTPAAAPVPAAPVSTAGKGLAIAGIIIDFFIPIVGLILSIIAKVQSKRAGIKNTAATVGVALGIIFTVGYVILFTVLGVVLGGVAAKCGDLGPGVHHVGGTTYTCS